MKKGDNIIGLTLTLNSYTNSLHIEYVCCNECKLAGLHNYPIKLNLKGNANIPLLIKSLPNSELYIRCSIH